jgi:hypothetical protein
MPDRVKLPLASLPVAASPPATTCTLAPASVQAAGGVGYHAAHGGATIAGRRMVDQVQRAQCHCRQIGIVIPAAVGGLAGQQGVDRWFQDGLVGSLGGQHPQRQRIVEGIAEVAGGIALRQQPVQRTGGERCATRLARPGSRRQQRFQCRVQAGLAVDGKRAILQVVRIEESQGAGDGARIGLGAAGALGQQHPGRVGDVRGIAAIAAIAAVAVLALLQLLDQGRLRHPAVAQGPGAPRHVFGAQVLLGRQRLAQRDLAGRRRTQQLERVQRFAARLQRRGDRAGLPAQRAVRLHLGLQPAQALAQRRILRPGGRAAQHQL